MLKHDSDFMERISRDLQARKAAAKILGVGASASMNDLKKAYREAAAKYHPDHNGNTPEANNKFVLIRCAYELLALDGSPGKLLEEINSWPGVAEDTGCNPDNPWGHFLWWREKFFESNEHSTKSAKPKYPKQGSCI